MTDQNAQKQAAALAAIEEISDGMVVGLGTGSTAALAVAALGERVAKGLRIVGIPTSERTAKQAREVGIELTDFAAHQRIDVTIDGADEVLPGTLDLIKGLGGALLREKIVAAASDRLIIMVDETKIVPAIGSKAPIPVEVIAFGWEATARHLGAIGGRPSLRKGADGQPYLTDSANYILDCAFGPTGNAAMLESEIAAIVGVVESGLFCGLATSVIVAGSTGIEIFERD